MFRFSKKKCDLTFLSSLQKIFSEKNTKCVYCNIKPKENIVLKHLEYRKVVLTCDKNTEYKEQHKTFPYISVKVIREYTQRKKSFHQCSQYLQRAFISFAQTLKVLHKH